MSLFYVFALVFAATGAVIGAFGKSIPIVLIGAAGVLLAWPHVF